jgi:hypothetical protein
VAEKLLKPKDINEREGERKKVEDKKIHQFPTSSTLLTFTIKPLLHLILLFSMTTCLPPPILTRTPLSLSLSLSLSLLILKESEHTVR